MRRADRLFRIIQSLRRRRRPVTSAQLAEGLGVSQRTVYRDIRDLVDSGVPIVGEAGMGYVLSRAYDLPPLMFEETEIEALVLGARVVRSWGDRELARAAESLLSKVEAVVPEALRERIAATTLFAVESRPREELRRTLGLLRGAVRERRRVRFRYTDRAGVLSDREVRPLGLFYWGITWTLASWCELRRDFRSFRLDRME